MKRIRSRALRLAVDLAPMHVLLLIGLIGAVWFVSHGELFAASALALLALVAAIELALALAAPLIRRQG
ncbi:MAG TPA: hypothetical protein VF292_03055 [Rhodanobacteraceae bacterium]